MEGLGRADVAMAPASPRKKWRFLRRMVRTICPQGRYRNHEKLLALWFPKEILPINGLTVATGRGHFHI